MVLRMIVLTESDAPTKIRATIVSQKLREMPKATVASPKKHHRAQEDAALAADVAHLRDRSAPRRHRPNRLRRGQPAVLHRADVQHVAREKGQQGVGRREEGGEEIQQHASRG